MSKRILIIEDEEKLRRVLQLQLASAGYETELAATAEAGLRMAERADLVLTDLRLPGMDGLMLVERLSAVRPGVPVIVMTAYGSIETAVAAMKGGSGGFRSKAVFPGSSANGDGEGAGGEGAAGGEPPFEGGIERAVSH